MVICFLSLVFVAARREMKRAPVGGSFSPFPCGRSRQSTVLQVTPGRLPVIARMRFFNQNTLAKYARDLYRVLAILDASFDIVFQRYHISVSSYDLLII